MTSSWPTIPPQPASTKRIIPQVFARDTRSTTYNEHHQDQESQTASAEGKADEFISVGSKTIQPLDFFKVSGVDVAAGAVPLGWERCPDVAVALEMRLEADASLAGTGAVYGRGTLSTRSCEVRKQASTLSFLSFALRFSSFIIVIMRFRGFG